MNPLVDFPRFLYPPLPLRGSAATQPTHHTSPGAVCWRVSGAGGSLMFNRADVPHQLMAVKFTKWAPQLDSEWNGGTAQRNLGSPVEGLVLHSQAVRARCLQLLLVLRFTWAAGQSWDSLSSNAAILLARIHVT